MIAKEACTTTPKKPIGNFTIKASARTRRTIPSLFAGLCSPMATHDCARVALAPPRLGGRFCNGQKPHATLSEERGRGVLIWQWMDGCGCGFYFVFFIFFFLSLDEVTFCFPFEIQFFTEHDGSPY